MTPKEKAKDLYDKFYAWYPNQDAQFIAKQCALIAVDEILDVIYKDMDYQNVYSFYLEVKTEIEKL